MNIKQAKHIHMIGIKGVGMTMLAQFLAGQGKIVSGSDIADTFMTDQVLSKINIKVSNFSPANLERRLDLIIYSSAYNKDNNSELSAAMAAGTQPVLKYAEALGQVFNEQYGIAVVGSHGKTTTTAWLGFVLGKAGLGPSVMVGAYVEQFAGASIVGKSDYMVIEADEYQNKLKYFRPQGVLLNNIDYDHPDFFPDKEAYARVFLDFIAKIPKKGFLVTNFDDSIIRKTAAVNCRGKVVSYAIKETADYVAYNITCQNNRQYFKVKIGLDDSLSEAGMKESELGEFAISLWGRHNIYNALAVIAAAVEMNVDLSMIRKYLGEFQGSARRLEKMGEYRRAEIIDDYAHHPTEIKAALDAVGQAYAGKNIITVFHPHTFTRTKALLDDFADSFGGTDELIILDIYGSAREEQGGVHSKDLIAKIKDKKLRSAQRIKIKNIKYISTLKECEEYLRGHIGPNDLVLLMGAGDVFRIGENLVQ